MYQLLCLPNNQLAHCGFTIFTIFTINIPKKCGRNTQKTAEPPDQNDRLEEYRDETQSQVQYPSRDQFLKKQTKLKRFLTGLLIMWESSFYREICTFLARNFKREENIGKKYQTTLYFYTFCQIFCKQNRFMHIYQILIRC